MKKILTTLITAALALPAAAQTISFDTEDYQSISVYDTWEQSPFRLQPQQGNAAVIPNHLTQEDPILGHAPNTSARILGFQRSRYASNTYGVRINLKEPFRLTKQNRYLHVMVHMAGKPSPSRMMVIGLGKRVEEPWNWQTGEDEQFWALSATKVPASDSWQDQVFAFRGFSYAQEENPASGIDIHALVLVPDVASRQDMTQDFVCYFDQIEINTSSEKRFSTEKYAISFDKDLKPTRTDRRLNGVGLTVESATQTASGLHERFYSDCTSSAVFAARPGQSVRPTFAYTGAWMSGYVYVDWANDGRFATDLKADMTPAEGSDVVSYNAFSPTGATWYNSTGATVANGNQIGSGVPAFTIPASTPEGFYRMRYKVDWNSIDPAGNAQTGNLITANGGGIADVLLNVHGEHIRVSDQQLNGAIVTAADSLVLNNYEAPYGQPLGIRMVPAPGFTHNGIRVRYGYNLDQAQFNEAGNPQWFEVRYTADQFDAQGRLTLPAEVMRGAQMSIEGFYVETASTEAYQTLAAEARAALSRQGVGYPKADAPERTTLESLLGESAPSLQALRTALENFKNTTNIQVPVSGGVYTFTALSREGRKAYRTPGGYVEVTAETVIPSEAWYTCMGEAGAIVFTPQSGGEGQALVVAKKAHVFGTVTLSPAGTGFLTLPTPAEEPHFGEEQTGDTASWDWDATSVFYVRQVSGGGPEGPVEPAPVVIERPYVVQMGDTITDLSELRNDRAYYICARSGEGYLVWNSLLTDEYVSIKGSTNAQYQGYPSNPAVATYYQEVINERDPAQSWQILRKDGQWFLYQVGKKQYVTRSGRDYVFTPEPTSLDGIRPLGDRTFAFHAGGGMSDNSTNYACICTGESPNVLRNWRYDDHGSVMYIIENPNVRVEDLIEVGIQGTPSNQADTLVHDLQGRLAGHSSQWGRLSRGLYLIDRRKVLKTR